MILKFKSNVKVSFDEESISIHPQLEEVVSHEDVEYEIWVEKNETRLKSLTIVVPAQKFSFKQKVENEKLIVNINMISCKSEGDNPYPVGLDAIDLSLSLVELNQEDNVMEISAKGILTFDGEE